MKYSFEYRFYARSFRSSLRTAHGEWDERRGVIVRICDAEGNVGYGEAAPVPGFGTEGLAEIQGYCGTLGGRVSDEDVLGIPDDLKCCRFALESALHGLKRRSTVKKTLPVAGFWDGSKEAFVQPEGYRVFKMKIGVRIFKDEVKLFKKWAARVPKECSLRLDANGGLGLKETKLWLECLDNYENVEFLEQPLRVGAEDAMRVFADRFKTPIALDESVTGLKDLQRVVAGGWKGWLVVKPMLLGSLEGFLRWRECCPCPIVYSSAFETGIGVEMGLSIASTDTKNNYAVGYGNLSYFEGDRFSLHGLGSCIEYGLLKNSDYEAVWNACVPVK